MSRVLGRTAVGVLVAAVSVSAGVGVASAETEADTAATAAVPAWSVDTSAPAGLLPWSGGGFYVLVPSDVCSVDWTVIGGQGGTGAGEAAGGAGGELRVTTRGAAGQFVVLDPGTAGQPSSVGAAGGTNGGGSAGGTGTAGGGGGGAGSSVRLGTAVELVARGGVGGAGGGAGGSTGATASGNTVTAATGGPIGTDTLFDGSTGAPGGSGHEGAGIIRGVGTPCPATAPGAPRLVSAFPTRPEDDGIQLHVRPEVPRGAAVWAPVTGWEVTLDGGATWDPLPTTPVLESERPPGVADDGSRRGSVRGLPLGEHTVAVRVTSAAGPSAASGARTVRLLSTPTGITVTAGVSSLRVSWTRPAGEVRSFMAESYDAAQQGEGDPHSLCEATAEQRSCTMHAEPGRSYRVVVSSAGRQTAPLTSGIVAAPPVPSAVPASSGVLPVSVSSRELTAGSVVETHGGGYLPRSTVTVVVYSAPVVLTSVEVDGTGTFWAEVTLPADLPAGEHTLVATGVDTDGETRVLTRAVTVAGPAAAPATVVPAAAVPVAAVPAAPAPSSGGLAHTGAYVGVMAVGGVLTLVVGVALVLIGRRRRTTGRG
jgi:hypothetical protein